MSGTPDSLRQGSPDLTQDQTRPINRQPRPNKSRDADRGVIPKLSEEAWTLLALLHREADGGPRAPTMLEYAKAYSDLIELDLVQSRQITREGYSLMAKRYLSDPATG